MPTGYTQAVQNGTITDLKEYAMSCARAFGACIMMRDDPADAEIPEEFPASDYHAKALVEAQNELAMFDAMLEPDLRARYDADQAAAEKSHRESCRRKQTERARYEAMLKQVNEWNAPSDDHAEFKKFMASQLNESIKFDCTEYDRESPADFETWKAKTRENLSWYVDYHAKGHAEEIERTNQRNQWIRLLRESFQNADAQVPNA